MSNLLYQALLSIQLHIQPFEPELVSEHLPHFFVHAKYTGCSPSDWRQTLKLDNERPEFSNAHGKMIRPFVLSGMKKCRDLSGFRVDTCQIGTFFQVAMPTGESEIIKMRRSTV